MIAVAVFLPALASGWGDVGHTTINRAAAEKIPAGMPPFLKAAENRIAWLGPEPDRWRSELEKPLNEAQAPDHFIDLESVDWLKPLPPDRYRFIQAVYEYRAQHPQTGVPEPEKIGFQPYITIEIFDRLKVAFRQYRHAMAGQGSKADAEADAIFYAGWLGHYVGDGSNPMHTSIQYNGWVGPNPKGFSTAHDVHAKMETGFVNANPEVTRIADLVGKPRHLDASFRGLHSLPARIAIAHRACLPVGKRGWFRWARLSGVARVHSPAAWPRRADAAESLVHGVGGFSGGAWCEMKREQA